MENIELATESKMNDLGGIFGNYAVENPGKLMESPCPSEQRDFRNYNEQIAKLKMDYGIGQPGEKVKINVDIASGTVNKYQESQFLESSRADTGRTL